MRNVDRIRDLEKELDRCRRRASDLGQENGALRKRLAEAMEGAAETGRAVDAILAQTAVKYGERAGDTGERPGWRLSLPMATVSETLERYQVRARRDGTAGAYIVGVTERDNPD